MQAIACPQNREVRIFEDGKCNIGSQRSSLTLIESAPEAAYYFLSYQDDVWRPDFGSSAVDMLGSVGEKPALYCSNYSLTKGTLTM